MKKARKSILSLAPVAAALMAAYSPAWADDGVYRSGEVSVGLGYVDNENSQWGKFTGMTDNGTYGLLDINFLRRDSNTDTWIQLLGRNLGLDSRDLRLEQRRVGDWGYFVEFSQLPYNQPLTILTRTSGIGTPVQFPTGAASLPFAVPYELGTRRDSFTAGVSKALGMGFDVALRYRNETKEGDRRYSNQGSPAFNFLAEPIDYETNQLDAIVSYSGEKFQIQAGYYGTTFDNSNSALWTAAPNFATGANSIALPPDNQSHQGYLSGAYNFTPTTRGNFKVSYSQYTQNEAFFTPAGVGVPAGPFAATSRPSLDGKVENTLAEAGIVSRPIPKLTLRADWRYTDRNDETPRLQYVSGAASRDGFNVPLSRTTNVAKAEAQYLLPMGFRIIGGIDYDQQDREVTPTLRQVSWREETEEWSYRVELNRSLSETLNGRLSYVYSDRDGSVYLPANNNVDPDVIDPIHWADRKRDKWRLRLDWAPLEPLSLQFTADYADDKYDGRPLGPESGHYEFYGLDATYVVSETWQVVGWLSHGQNDFNQRTIGSVSTQPPQNSANTGRQVWYGPQHNSADAVGLGVRGKATARIEVGADLQYQEDQDEYDALAYNTGSLFLPEITNRRTTVTLFGKYAMGANNGLKLEYIYDRYSTNDWAWQIYPFAVHNNGTQVYWDSPQSVHFIGMSYFYRFQ
ncbi:MAG TPA: MtrB/PioB family decaheme-associated outer membrane protein [Burkholderiales bacterium]|nr:MtrB/PioB family decaheme-associated outer membrane protein [Burkholderiales bacterium]